VAREALLDFLGQLDSREHVGIFADAVCFVPVQLGDARRAVGTAQPFSRWSPQ